MKVFETQLGKNQYLVGDHMTVADISLLAMLWGNSRSCVIPTAAMKRLPNLAKWMNHMAEQEFHTKVFGKTFANTGTIKVPAKEEVETFIVNHKNSDITKARAMQGFPALSGNETTKAAPVEAKAQSEPKKLTGKAAIQAKQAEEAKAKEVKKAKPAVIAKSLVTFDVKGYELGQDFEGMAAKIRSEVNMDGLVWMDEHKVLEIAYGMKKLQMQMLIEDEKVMTDDVFELIEAWEDDVQSVDTVAMAKA